MDLEGKNAQAKYGHFNSTHEVYAVLAEEVEEFWELVKQPTLIVGKDGTTSKTGKMILELSQVRSVADRAIEELQESKIKFV